MVNSFGFGQTDTPPPSFSDRLLGHPAQLRRSYWDWESVLNSNRDGFFPYTPASNLLFGLREAADMLLEEGLDAVFDRHARLAGAVRAAVEGWNLEILCAEPDSRSNTLTAVTMPQGNDADKLRQLILRRFNISLGKGLGKLTGKVFRIGHLGDLNEPMLMGTLCGIEMGLAEAGVPFRHGGIAAAMTQLQTAGS